MNLKKQLKNSRRYEYDIDEHSFVSHKYKSAILFLNKDWFQYIVYDNACPEGNVIFEMISHISLNPRIKSSLTCQKSSPIIYPK